MGIIRDRDHGRVRQPGGREILEQVSGRRIRHTDEDRLREIRSGWHVGNGRDEGTRTGHLFGNTAHDNRLPAGGRQDDHAGKRRLQGLNDPGRVSTGDVQTQYLSGTVERGSDAVRGDDAGIAAGGDLT